MNFQSGEKKLQTAWKLTAKGLPRGAKRPGLYRNRMYPFCLPLEHAGYNLFHEIRRDAIDTFSRHGIIWHCPALPGLPSNHLCSSQVFAVNLLFPFIDKPDALAAALRPYFPDIETMLSIEDKRYIAFEWIGSVNYLGEDPKIGDYRMRGAGNTSIDAAVMYENAAKEKVMLLIEIKYSESYGVCYKRFRSDGTDRFQNYEPFFFDKVTPINLSVAPRLQDFLYEPFYQLLRQTLLANQIMKTGKPKVNRVQVVHLRVDHNKNLLAVTSPKFRELGNTTYEVWRKVLKDPSGFTLIPAEEFFANPALAEYEELEPWRLYMKTRYSFLR
jgi:hypothetical protein